MAKLSAAELKYARSYKQILNRHFMDSFLKDIPERLRNTEEVKTDVNMGSFCILYSSRTALVGLVDIFGVTNGGCDTIFFPPQ